VEEREYCAEQRKRGGTFGKERRRKRQTLRAAVTEYRATHHPSDCRARTMAAALLPKFKGRWSGKNADRQKAIDALAQRIRRLA
jgi:hypothetical protein